MWSAPVVLEHCTSSDAFRSTTMKVNMLDGLLFGVNVRLHCILVGIKNGVLGEMQSSGCFYFFNDMCYANNRHSHRKKFDRSSV